MTFAVHCPHCGAEVGLRQQTCPHCGHVLEEAPLVPGTVLSARYRLGQPLQSGHGAGVMGKVLAVLQPGFAQTIWRAEELPGGRPLLLREFTPDPSVRVVDVVAKLSAFARLRHAHIAPIIDIFDYAGHVLLAMEYVEGHTLEEVLADHPHGAPGAQVLSWGEQLSSALDYLHTQDPPIIYRDLRPAVVLVDPWQQTRLVDFGYARLFNPAKTGDTHRLGTPGFVAPEMYAHEQTDARSDVYSLGVTLHRMLTHHNPATTFPTLPPVRELNPALSPELAAVIARATQIEPGERYQTAVEMGAALRACPEYTAVDDPRPSEHGG